MNFFAKLTSFIRKENESLEWISHEIMHELRSTLAIIQSGVGGVNHHFFTLLDVYNTAVENKLKVPELFPQDIFSLKNALYNVEKEVYYVNQYIHMMTLNMKNMPEFYDKKALSIQDIGRKAFNSFLPRKKTQKDILNPSFNFDDFHFFGNEEIAVNLIKNLIHFSLSRMMDHNSKIMLTTTLEENKCLLYFEDTGKMILPHKLKNMFKLAHRGLGEVPFGMVFCAKAMKFFQGSIECISSKTETQFILTFPTTNKMVLS